MLDVFVGDLLGYFGLVVLELRGRSLPERNWGGELCELRRRDFPSEQRVVIL